jgi:hypothetical protein
LSPGGEPGLVGALQSGAAGGADGFATAGVFVFRGDVADAVVGLTVL